MTPLNQAIDNCVKGCDVKTARIYTGQLFSAIRSLSILCLDWTKYFTLKVGTFEQLFLNMCVTKYLESPKGVETVHAHTLGEYLKAIEK